MMALPGGDSRLWANAGHHSPCLCRSPALCPSLLPAGQVLRNQIAEICSLRSFLLLDTLRPGSRTPGTGIYVFLDSSVGWAPFWEEGSESMCSRRRLTAWC